MKANWGHLRNIFTIITAGALAVHPVQGRSSPQASRSSGFSPPPSSHRSGLPAGLWPPVPAPGSGCVSLRLQETQPGKARPGWASSQVQPGLGVQDEGRQSRLGSRLGQPPPHVQQSESGPGPSGPLHDMATGQAGALRPRRRRRGTWAPVTLWEAGASLGQTESQRLSSCKVVTHRPPGSRRALLDGASAGPPPPHAFGSASVSFSKFRDQLSLPWPRLSRKRAARPAGLPVPCSRRPRHPQQGRGSPICPQLRVALDISAHWVDP